MADHLSSANAYASSRECVGGAFFLEAAHGLTLEAAKPVVGKVQPGDCTAVMQRWHKAFNLVAADIHAAHACWHPR